MLKLLNLHLLLLESLSVGETTLESLRLLLMHLLMIGIIYLRHRIHLHVLILLHLVTKELNRALERVGELLPDYLAHIILILIGVHLIVHRMILLRHALIAHLMLGVGVSDAAVLPIELLSFVGSLEIVALMILLRETLP